MPSGAITVLTIVGGCVALAALLTMGHAARRALRDQREHADIQARLVDVHRRGSGVTVGYPVTHMKRHGGPFQ